MPHIVSIIETSTQNNGSKRDCIHPHVLKKLWVLTEKIYKLDLFQTLQK